MPVISPKRKHAIMFPVKKVLPNGTIQLKQTGLTKKSKKKLKAGFKRTTDLRKAMELYLKYQKNQKIV